VFEPDGAMLKLPINLLVTDDASLERYQARLDSDLDKVKSVHWDTIDCAISGSKAYCEYLRTATHPDGTQDVFLSVDILTYRDGLIVHKDTYYKQRTA
ncbi:MAG: hypothetical protein AAF386_14250, partial [Pseudomonadota bacterium]